MNLKSMFGICVVLSMVMLTPVFLLAIGVASVVMALMVLPLWCFPSGRRWLVKVAKGAFPEDTGKVGGDNGPAPTASRPRPPFAPPIPHCPDNGIHF